MKAFFAILFLALVSFEVTQANVKYENVDLNEIERGLFDDLVKKCQDLINSLVNTVKNASQNAISQIGGLKDVLKGMFDTAIAKATEEFNAIKNNALGQINEWVDKAEQLGIDVKECYQTSETEIKNLPQQFLNAAMQCFTTEYNHAMQIITDSQSIITDLVQQFNDLNLSEKLSGCMNAGWSAFSCVYGVISEVTGLATSLPSQISAKVAEVVAFVQGVPVRLQACTLSQAVAMQEQVTSIVNNVIACIKTKLGMAYPLLN